MGDLGALGEGRHLEDAHGAVPDDGAGVAISSEKSSTVLGPMSRAIRSAGIGCAFADLARDRVGVEFVGDDVIDGQQEFHVLRLLASASSWLGEVDLVVFDQRLADLCPCALRKV